jgi:DNA ligase 1
MGKEEGSPATKFTSKGKPKAKNTPKGKDGNIASFFGGGSAPVKSAKTKYIATFFDCNSSAAKNTAGKKASQVDTVDEDFDEDDIDDDKIDEAAVEEMRVVTSAAAIFESEEGDGGDVKDEGDVEEEAVPPAVEYDFEQVANQKAAPVRARKRRIVTDDDEEVDDSEDNAFATGDAAVDIDGAVSDRSDGARDTAIAGPDEVVDAQPAAKRAKITAGTVMIESEPDPEVVEKAVVKAVAASASMRKPLDDKFKYDSGNDHDDGDNVAKPASAATAVNGDVDVDDDDDEVDDDEDDKGSDSGDGESDGEDKDAGFGSGDGEGQGSTGGDSKLFTGKQTPIKKKKIITKSVKSASLDFSDKPAWKAGKPVPYAVLAETFSKVEAIHGRLEIQAILTDLFRKIIDTTPEDLTPAIYLCVNKVGASHEGMETGVGENILMQALCKTTGSSLQTMRAKAKEAGDLGDVAYNSRTTQTTMFPPPPLTIRKVFGDMRLISQATGKNVNDVKKGKILKMLVATVTKNEAKFLARALQGKLRIHLADKTVIVALASAFTLNKLMVGTGALLSVDGKKKTKLTAKEEDLQDALKDAANRLSSIYNELPMWEKIVPSLLKHKEVNDKVANECKFRPGVPVSPMLAKPTTAISDVLERLGETAFTCEYKYDGERAQVHRLPDGSVKIYSRNAEDLTPKYPDLVIQLPKSLKDKFKGASFVLDSESVAYDIGRKQILPFQELQQRKRKDVDELAVTIQVCVFAFDLLYFNGESLLKESLKKRRQILSESFDEVEGVFMFAKGHDSREPDEIMDLLNESIKAGCEGLMVKALDGPNSTYQPANRTQNWVKVKKDYLAGMGDTLDLVPIAGYLGRGKRVGFYGGFLLACYDAENEEYQTICKIGTGFSDIDLDTFSKFYKEEGKNRVLEQKKPYYRFSGSPNLKPDVWFEPCQVWEVLCADLSISPAHTAAIGHVDEKKGIALRFPRFVRTRDDKVPDDATSSEQVAEFYSRQHSVANNKPTGKPRT